MFVEDFCCLIRLVLNLSICCFLSFIDEVITLYSLFDFSMICKHVSLGFIVNFESINMSGIAFKIWEKRKGPGLNFSLPR